jgi:hypothetical protein
MLQVCTQCGAKLARPFTGTSELPELTLDETSREATVAQQRDQQAEIAEAHDTLRCCERDCSRFDRLAVAYGETSQAFRRLSKGDFPFTPTLPRDKGVKLVIG